MKIAIAQLNPTIGNLPKNAQQILKVAQEAAELGANLLLTPELSLCGYPPRDLLLNPGFIQLMSATLQDLARDLPHQLYVFVGTVEPNHQAVISGGKSLFNSMALLYQGQVQQIFHKRLLPTYDVFDEDRYFEPGLKPNFFDLKIQDQSLKVGVTICEDLWNDEDFWGKKSYAVNPIEDLIQQNVDVVINLSASPYTVGKSQVREAMLSHSASRHQTPIIYVNQVGGNDDLIFDGGSFAVNQAGELVSRLPAFQTGLEVLELSPDTQDLLPGKIAPHSPCKEAEIWQALVLGVRDYAQKCGFSKIVLGLSGGIDSALVAAIASAAVGAENVLGILMPSPYSSDHSVTDALELGKNLGIQTQIIPIGELMTGYDRTLESLFADTSFGIAEENIQSRIRGNLLMAVANKFGYLLISTGNKSEMAVGYCTLYGDMNGGLAAIADVPKTLVYDLCRWINRHFEQYQIPENILSKAPSAELKPGQTDQDSLPPYEVLDDILQRLIQGYQSPAQIINAGHDPQIVSKVVNLVAKAEFKRRQAPPGLKITDRAFGTGWRMPIASRWILSSQS